MLGWKQSKGEVIMTANLKSLTLLAGLGCAAAMPLYAALPDGAAAPEFTTQAPLAGKPLPVSARRTMSLPLRVA